MIPLGCLPSFPKYFDNFSSNLIKARPFWMISFRILAIIHAMTRMIAAPPTLGRYSMTVLTRELIGPVTIGRLSTLKKAKRTKSITK